jgi:hypothetical protein
MRWVVGGWFVAGVWLALAGSAAALCTCGDRDGCASAAACAGQIPGAECGKGRTCKIVVGTGNDLTCCCGCSKGVGPIGCNYAGLGEVGFTGSVACGSEPLAAVAEKVAAATTARLAQADAACRAGKNAAKRARAGRRQLGRLRRKIDRFERKRQIDAACAANARALLDELVADIDAIEAGGAAPAGPTTTSTTSTTLPGGPSCSATFTTFDSFEVDFVLGCFVAGSDYTGFTLRMNGGRMVTNHLPPPSFTCAVATEASPDDSLVCTGNFKLGDQISGGRIRTSPAPVADMDAGLFVHVGGSRYGPFPTTGP